MWRSSHDWRWAFVPQRFLCLHFDFLFVACLCAKSVVALSYLWLPEAMEGPTPVSALLHSCTLVMAGLFTLFRNKTQYSLPLLPLMILSLICLAMSVFEADVKRIVAYSTVSLVSFLWFVVCLHSEHSFVGIALLHASYKSALFVCLGRLIANSEHASLSVGDSKSMLSICQLLVLVAFAPVGSSYIALKHAALAIDLSSSAITGLVAFASCCSAILAWILQLRLYPAAFGLTRFRFFAPAIHDWFGILLLLTFCMVAVSLVLPGNAVIDGNGTLSFGSVCSRQSHTLLDFGSFGWEVNAGPFGYALISICVSIFSVCVFKFISCTWLNANQTLVLLSHLVNFRL